MTAVRVPDVLLRVFPKNLERFQSLAVPGASRGRERPLPFTHARADASTCAPYLGQDGKLYVAAANKLRIDYTPYWADGLTWPDGSPKGGIALMRSRVNLCTWSDALSNWTSAGTPLVTDAFATLGDLGLTLIEDDDATAAETKTLGATFTGDGVKGGVMYASAPATVADAVNSQFRIIDTTAVADRFRITAFNWNADGTLGTPTVPTGTIIRTAKLGLASHGRPVYAIYFQTTAITAANNNRIDAMPSGTTVANLGKMLIGGVMVVDQEWPPLHRVKTTGSTVTVAADGFTVPFNYGPLDMSAGVSMYRPIHAGLVLTTQLFPCVFKLGGAAHSNVAPYLEGFFRHDGSAPYTSLIRNPTGVDSRASVNVPVGNDLTFLQQFKDLGTNPETALDVGSGLSGFSAGSAGAFTSFGIQTLTVGAGDLPLPSTPLDGLLFDLTFLRGLRTRAEYLAAAAA